VRRTPVAFEIVPDGHGFILSGELDMAVAPDLATALREVIGTGAPVAVDMRQVTFMDSSGIQAIIAALRAAEDGCIILHGVHDEVQKVVELTKIERLPNLHVVPCTVGVDEA
jgi:anti-sigma B factor antagonist